MSDSNRTRPHLVAVGDPASEASETAPEEVRSGDDSGRGAAFWLLVALALAVTVGLVIQTQRAGELEGTIAALEGELFTTRTALDAYEARFEEVRDSVGSLQAQLEALNALVNADPLEVAPEAPADAVSPPESLAPPAH
jgi:uncharacterized protein HemX